MENRKLVKELVRLSKEVMSRGGHINVTVTGGNVGLRVSFDTSFSFNAYDLSDIKSMFDRFKISCQDIITNILANSATKNGISSIDYTQSPRMSSQGNVDDTIKLLYSCFVKCKTADVAFDFISNLSLSKAINRVMDYT